MKNILLILLIVLATACGKGGAGSGNKTEAVINPELYGHIWQFSYSVGPHLYSDQLSAMDEDVLLQTYSAGSLVAQKNWTIKPLTATTMKVSDGVDTFTATYEINGNVMDLCYEDGSCDTFMY